jgi:hypothetical protein
MAQALVSLSEGIVSEPAPLEFTKDVGLLGKDDPIILAWAAEENRVLLTHDVATITNYAYERITQGQPMPGNEFVETEKLYFILLV